MTGTTALRRVLSDRSVRGLTLSVFATTVGTGTITTGGLVYFAESAGLATGDIVLGMTVAGVLGLLFAVYVGDLADRLGARAVCAAMLLLRAAGTALFLVTDSFPVFLLGVVVVAVADAGGGAAGDALTAAVGGPDRLTVRAMLHSVVNAGVAIGAVVAGITIGIGTRFAFAAMIVGAVVSLCAATAALIWVAPVPPVERPQDSHRWESLKDRRYLVMTGLHAVLSLHFDVMTFAIPLWLLHTGAAPAWLISVLMIVNTVMVIALQVPASAGADTVAGAARLGRRAGLVLLGGLALLGYAGTFEGWVAVGLLLAGAVVLTLGELWQSASAFGLSFDLAPDHAQGQYQGVFGIGRGVAKALAPALLGVLCLQWGIAGWLLLGLILSAAGVALPLFLARTSTIKAGESVA